MVENSMVFVFNMKKELGYLDCHHKDYVEAFIGRACLSHELAFLVEAKVGDFRHQDKWILPEIFDRLFPDIVQDIEHVTVAEGCKDEIIWSPCLTGIPRTKDFYEHLRSKGAITNWGNEI
ncbi:hypothetical protein TIFTF001_001873 [Ficus carica]|uniref:Uncharacterized protein n=1 Tax=Ficus carica TaxID=3494 RepID=A0AA88D5V5_FICCA|nr:hypothetical protein TIFTF001_001873 [Ficus carica]